MLKNKRGFTLLEIATTVAVIGIILAVALALFVRTKITENESMAQASLEAYRSAFEIFKGANPSIAYPARLSELQGYVDEPLVSSRKNGYNFSLTQSGPDTYQIVATPTQPRVTGVRTFVLDQSGTIRQGDLSFGESVLGSPSAGAALSVNSAVGPAGLEKLGSDFLETFSRSVFAGSPKIIA